MSEQSEALDMLQSRLRAVRSYQHGCDRLCAEVADALTRTREELEEAKRDRDEAYELVTAYAADSVSRADWEAKQADYARISEAFTAAWIRAAAVEAELSAAREALKGAEEALSGAATFLGKHVLDLPWAARSKAGVVAVQLAFALSALRPAQGKDPAGFRDPLPPRNSTNGGLDSPP